MPLEPHTENPMGLAASFVGRALPLIVRKSVSTYQDLSD
jgi:hypothetical protein